MMSVGLERWLRAIGLKREQRGATAVFVAIVLFLFIGVTALAIDISHLYVVRTELQRAADAGALAGALYLLEHDTGKVNTGANDEAYETATQNMSDKTAVETGGPDIQRGHWDFITREFTPNESSDNSGLDLQRTAEELYADTNFVNAVQVRARRGPGTPAASFFARVFGHEGFNLEAEAIAFVGFAGTLKPEDVDQPIAICKESLIYSGAYSCSIGRMINSGQNVSSHETGGWTDFNQDSPCTGGTNASTVKSLVCGDGNPQAIRLGQPIATNGGEINSAFNNLVSCWQSKTGKTVPWNLTLPVVECPGNNIGTCEKVVGAVNLNILWINDKTDPQYKNVPKKMGDWSCPAGFVGKQCWDDFVRHFNLKNVDGGPAPYDQKSIYFKPDCSVHEPVGVTGGENFGILAEIPLLVQ